MDAKVDRIVGIILQHIESVQGYMDMGVPSGSKRAYDALEILPNYTVEYEIIKNELTPEQNARIQAENKNSSASSVSGI